MADKLYQLPYDAEIDKDIADWLNSLPRARKAELVRNAIRFYLQASQGDGVLAVNPSSLTSASELKQTPDEAKSGIGTSTSKKRPTGLPKNGDF